MTLVIKLEKNIYQCITHCTFRFAMIFADLLKFNQLVDTWMEKQKGSYSGVVFTQKAFRAADCPDLLLQLSKPKQTRYFVQRNMRSTNASVCFCVQK